MISASDRSARVGLGERETRRTVNQLVDEHEVVLHRFLIHLAKVRLCYGDKAVTELEYEGGVRVAPARKRNRSGARR